MGGAVLRDTVISGACKGNELHEHRKIDSGNLEGLALFNLFLPCPAIDSWDWSVAWFRKREAGWTLRGDIGMLVVTTDIYLQSMVLLLWSSVVRVVERVIEFLDTGGVGVPQGLIWRTGQLKLLFQV